MADKSIFNAIYYGAVSPWEERVPQTKEYKEHIEKTCSIQEKLYAMIDDDTKTLFDNFLKADGELTSYFEEEKFKDGFILGARLMIETFQDTRFQSKECEK